MAKWSWMLIPLLLLVGCATTTPDGHQSRAKASAFAFLNSYKAALSDFAQGRIMEARAKIVAMDTTREDYPAAQKLLRQKLDPSRRKMLQFYLDRARLREKQGKWKLAARDFGQAAYFSTKPRRWKQQQQRLEMKVRQRRFDLLRRVLQREDRVLLSWPSAVAPPKQLVGDALIKGWQARRWDALDDRAQVAYSEAGRYLRADLPELAYAEVKSMLRLDSGDGRGVRLLREVKKRLPPQISLKKVRFSRNRPNRASKRGHKLLMKDLGEQTIQRLIADHRWSKARQYTLAWKRQQGNNADLLLRQLNLQAKRFYDQGRLAVKQERLSEAVRLWKQAVALMPDSEEFSKALEWAEQMQERLRLLRNSHTGIGKSEMKRKKQ
ncbi:MAG: hypothetical protein R8J84_03755 [Mariprofundales bacterium]